MLKDKDSEYSKTIIERLRQIMESIDLDTPGFAAFLEKSVPHIYGILNGSRELSEVLAREIGRKLEFDGARIFNINSPIPISINRSKILITFRAENRDNFEYFSSTRSKRSINTFIKEVLVKSTCFDDGYKYLSEITKFCLIELNRKFIGDELSKALQYACEIKILKSIKKPIKKQNGKLGLREVNVYFK